MAVTSANLSNIGAATNILQVKEYFSYSNPAAEKVLDAEFTNNQNLALLVDGKQSSKFAPSTIIKVFNNQITILRQGPINNSLILDL